MTSRTIAKKLASISQRIEAAREGICGWMKVTYDLNPDHPWPKLDGGRLE